MELVFGARLKKVFQATCEVRPKRFRILTKKAAAIQRPRIIAPKHVQGEGVKGKNFRAADFFYILAAVRIRSIC